MLGIKSCLCAKHNLITAESNKELTLDKYFFKKNIGHIR